MFLWGQDNTEWQNVSGMEIGDNGRIEDKENMLLCGTLMIEKGCCKEDKIYAEWQNVSCITLLLKRVFKNKKEICPFIMDTEDKNRKEDSRGEWWGQWILSSTYDVPKCTKFSNVFGIVLLKQP